MDEMSLPPNPGGASSQNNSPPDSEKSPSSFEQSVSTSKLNRFIRFLIRFGTVITIAVIAVLPFKLIGTFLHELGHIISYLLIRQSVSFIMNILQGYSAWSYYEIEWYEEFWTAASGILFSSILLGVCIVRLQKIRPKSLPKCHFMFGCLILELILQGPIYLGLTFAEQGDPVQMMESLTWYLRTQNNVWDPFWYFTIGGFVIGFIATYFLIQQLSKDFMQLHLLFWKQSLSIKRSLGYATGFVFIYYIFRSMVDEGLNVIYANQTFLFFQNPPTSSYILDFYGAGVFIIVFILLGAFLNFTLIRPQNISFYQKNQRIHITGAVFIIILLLFPAFGWYSNSSINSSSQLSSNITYQFTHMSVNGSQYYILYGFTNRTAESGSSQQAYSGIGITVFDPVTFSWNKSMILLQDYDLLSRITDFAYVFDEQNRLWLFYVENGDVLHDSQCNSTYYIKAWDMANFGETQIGNPILNLNKSWNSMRITDDFITNVNYDPFRKIMWVAYTNNTYNYTTVNGIPTYSTAIFITTFNLTDYSWSESCFWNHTLANNGLSTASSLTFHTNGNISFDVLDGSYLYHTEYSQRQGEPLGSMMQYDTDPQIIRGLTTREAFISHLCYEPTRNLLLMYEDRDIWLEIYSSDWMILQQRIRITIDFAKQYPLAWLNNGSEYEILISAYGSLPVTMIHTEDSSFTQWKRVEPFPLL